MDRKPVPDGRHGSQQEWEEQLRRCLPPEPAPKPEQSIWWRIFWWPVSIHRHRKH